MVSVKTKELTPLRAKVSKALFAANQLQVTEREHLIGATNFLSKLKELGKAIKEDKDFYIKPQMAFIESVREKFAPIEEDFGVAERLVKSKMLSFNADVERKAIAERLKIAAKVEAGTMKFETGARKIAKLETAEKTIQAELGQFQTREMKRFEVTDKSKLPIEYLVPDEIAIRKAMNAGIELPGVTYSVEKVAVINTRSLDK